MTRPSGVLPPRLVWNASASSPRGLYLVVSGSPRVGDVVVAWPPTHVAGLAEARGYLAGRVPLVKTVTATGGIRACASGARVFLGRRRAAIRRPADGAGRALPWWRGCRVLAADELWLSGNGDPASFDSRYFGPVRAGCVIGRARLLWVA